MRGGEMDNRGTTELLNAVREATEIGQFFAGKEGITVWSGNRSTPTTAKNYHCFSQVNMIRILGGDKNILLGDTVSLTLIVEVWFEPKRTSARLFAVGGNVRVEFCWEVLEMVKERLQTRFKKAQWDVKSSVNDMIAGATLTWQ